MEEEMKALRDEVMTTLRACLMSTKGGVPLDNVNRDYRSVEGENIPYRKLGCSSLEEFISQVPRVRKYRRGQDVYVEVVPDESTAHLAELISKQRNSKRKSSRMSMSSRRPVINNRYNGNGMSNGRAGSRFYDARAQPHSPRRFVNPRPSQGQMRQNSSVNLGRNNTTVYPAKTELKVTVYPGKTEPKVTVYPAKPLVQSSERKVTVYPGKTEEKVTVYPGKLSIPSSEPKVTVYPAKSVVKTEPSVVIYPGGSSKGEHGPEVTRMQERSQEYPQKVQNDQQGIYNGNSGVNGVTGNFVGPRTPPVSPVSQGYGGQRWPSPPIVKSSAAIGDSSTMTLNGFKPINGYLTSFSQSPILPQAPNNTARLPPPLKAVRPLSERLRRPSPDPHPEISMDINTASKPLPNPSNPFTYSTPPTPPPEVSPNDPREELKLLARKLNLPEPEYKNVRNVEQKGRVSVLSVYSEVQIGPNHKYLSYPAEADNEIEADKFAAIEALKKLHQLDRPIKLRITTDKKLIQQRILAIVDDHPNGVFRDKLPAYYEEKHNEALPDDWTKVIEQLTELSLQKGRVDNSIFVCRRVPDDPRIRIPPLSPIRQKPLFTPTNDTTPVPLKLPNNSLWPVYVSHIFSTSEVWIRLLEDEYNEKFFSMSQDLTLHYSAITTPSPTIEITNFYVTKVNDEAHRVRVEALDPLTGDAEIFFIDSGDNDIVHPTQLFPLDKKYLNVPPQAIRACLSTLEDIADCSIVSKAADKHLLEKTFYVQVLNLHEDESSHVITGVFYDTSSAVDVNVNDLISKEIMVSSKPDAYIVRGKISEVSVSHIEENGDVYLQVNNDGLEIVKGMIRAAMENSEDEIIEKAVVRGPLEIGEVYLAQKPDTEWVRVVFAEGEGQRGRMIDFGGCVDVDIGKLLRLREFCGYLVEFPRQCLKVELNNIGKKFNERINSRLRELAGFGEPLLCKVVGVVKRGPVVELFKRSQTDNLLISINNTLDLEPVLGKCEDGHGKKKRLERRGSRSSDETMKRLKQPRIAGVGKYFQVHVGDLVINPGDFVVQPLEEKPKLQAMMEALQNSYKTLDGSKMYISELEKGKVYAVKNDHGYWYRACLDRVIDEQSVIVHFCDFGKIEVIRLNQIQPLKKEFYDLPYQAIKARLFGIQPMSSNWSLQTCIKFRKLVETKDFVSEVKDLEHDDSTPPNIILTLELIDVSGDEDIYIHKLLIDEGRVLPK